MNAASRISAGSRSARDSDAAPRSDEQREAPEDSRPLDRDSVRGTRLVRERLPGNLERICCPLCEGDRHDVLFRRRDDRLLTDRRLFPVVRCLDCGFVFLNPRPDSREIHRYYSSAFYRATELPEEALQLHRRKLDAMCRWLSHLPPARLLDVGCFKGEFMHEMFKRGWSAKGVEFSTVPENNYGLDIFYGDVAELPDRPQYDATTLWAVLEHVADPRRTIEECARLTRQGGRLFILVPNFNSIPGRFLRHDDVPRHLMMFTRRTLRRLLAECGFVVRRCVCEQQIYMGSVRGLVNFMVKRLGGESTDEILSQYLLVDRWAEFARHINGAPHRIMERVDNFDISLYPKLDRLLDRAGFGFIMVTEAERI
jgi:SAM-dependent methyltransferase